jgi:4-diphosphocytidyl-2C-methyl-D-erythritol kinase
MDYIRIKAYAKINLTLDIVGMKDNYHMLDSVVASVDLYDLITIKKRKKDKLVTICMKGLGSESIPFEQNNGVKAAERFISAFDTCGVDITIYKNIPMGAGLGGSSADVAGVLNGMKKLFAVEDEDKIKDIADGIGSDCGYMLCGGYARISGRGEIVKPLDSDLKLNLVALIPSTPVSTPACYRAYDNINCKIKPSSEKAEEAVLSNNINDLAATLSNSLLAPAVHLNSDVGEAVVQLKEFAPLGVNMTGSGSCVYALFENDQFCRYALSRYRGQFKILQLKTIIPKREKKDGRRETY